MKRILLVFLALLLASPALAQKPPINGVAGPTTSAQFLSITTNPNGSGPLTYGASPTFTGTTSLGGTSGDALVFNAGAWTLNNNFTATRTMGAAPAGTTIASGHYQTQFSGNAANNTDIRATVENVTSTGTNSIAGTLLKNMQVEVWTTSGNTTDTRAIQGYVRLGCSNASPTGGCFGGANISGGTLTNGIVFDGHVANESNVNMSFAAPFYASGVDLADGSGLIHQSYGFYAGDWGHATRIDVAAASYMSADMTGGAPITAAFRTLMSSGTDKWAASFEGTANSRFGGNLIIGRLDTTPLATLDLRKTSAGALTIPIYAQNGGGTASTEVGISLDPTGNGPNVRDTLIVAGTAGGNVNYLRFAVANGDTPADVFKILPGYVVSMFNIYAVNALTTWPNNQTCVAGQMTWDASFIYVCTATNTVKRATLGSF